MSWKIFKTTHWMPNGQESLHAVCEPEAGSIENIEFYQAGEDTLLVIRPFGYWHGNYRAGHRDEPQSQSERNVPVLLKVGDSDHEDQLWAFENEGHITCGPQGGLSPDLLQRIQGSPQITVKTLQRHNTQDEKEIAGIASTQDLAQALEAIQNSGPAPDSELDQGLSG